MINGTGVVDRLVAAHFLVLFCTISSQLHLDTDRFALAYIRLFRTRVTKCFTMRQRGTKVAKSEKVTIDKASSAVNEEKILCKV